MSRNRGMVIPKVLGVCCHRHSSAGAGCTPCGDSSSRHAFLSTTGRRRGVSWVLRGTQENDAQLDTRQRLCLQERTSHGLQGRRVLGVSQALCQRLRLPPETHVPQTLVLPETRTGDLKLENGPQHFWFWNVLLPPCPCHVACSSALSPPGRALLGPGQSPLPPVPRPCALRPGRTEPLPHPELCAPSAWGALGPHPPAPSAPAPRLVVCVLPICFQGLPCNFALAL